MVTACFALGRFVHLTALFEPNEQKCLLYVYPEKHHVFHCLPRIILMFFNYRNYESIKINAGDKFAHVSVGNLQHFEGKQFVKEATEANSCEISFGSLPSGESVPFFHTHENNEENYIILSGSGKFQVNDSVFDISEGSVVRVSTHCDRCLKCTSDAPMLYLCIQAKENSLGGYTLDDAAITERVSLL